MKNSVPQAILIGIDPGYDRIGWAVCQTEHHQLVPLGYGCIRTNAKETQLQRYQQLARELSSILQQYHPTDAAVESVFFSTNQKTGIAVAQARGIILAQLFVHQVTIYEYTPLQIKLATTGYGSADKAAVEKMVRLQIGLPKTRIIDDAIDALAMVITLQARLRSDRASML